MTAVFTIDHLHKSFGTKKVLDGLSLSVEKGQSLVVIGGSGTGKSVLIKCILGLLQPDKGSIIYEDGLNLAKASADEYNTFYKKTGMLFQGAALFDSLPVWENVAFSLLNNDKISRKQAKEIAAEKLVSVGLSHRVADLMPSELSGGMKKRVGLARAIATSPEILFFDEPTTGLDPIMTDVINELIVDSVKKLGATAITITHDMGSVRKIADKVALIYEGKIIWEDDVAALDQSGNPYVEQFVCGKADGPMSLGQGGR